MTHICIGKLTNIGSNNGLSPGRHQAIIWTNAVKLLIGPLGKNFSEVLIEIWIFSLEKIRLKLPSAKCCPFRLDLNVLKLQMERWSLHWNNQTYNWKEGLYIETESKFWPSSDMFRVTMSGCQIISWCSFQCNTNLISYSHKDFQRVYVKKHVFVKTSPLKCSYHYV